MPLPNWMILEDHRLRWKTRIVDEMPERDLPGDLPADFEYPRPAETYAPDILTMPHDWPRWRGDFDAWWITRDRLKYREDLAELYANKLQLNRFQSLLKADDQMARQPPQFHLERRPTVRIERERSITVDSDEPRPRRPRHQAPHRGPTARSAASASSNYPYTEADDDDSEIQQWDDDQELREGSYHSVRRPREAPPRCRRRGSAISIREVSTNWRR